MLVDNLMQDAGPSIYYNDAFRVVLEDHVSTLRNNSLTKVVTVPPHSAYKYEGDFYGLLSSLNIPPHYHWLVMRMTGFTSTLDATRGIQYVLVPETNTLERIRQSHMSKIKTS